MAYHEIIIYAVVISTRTRARTGESQFMAKVMGQSAQVSGNVKALPVIAALLEGFASVNEYASQHRQGVTRSVSVQGQIGIPIIITVDGEEGIWTKYANEFTRRGSEIRFERTKRNGRRQLVTAVLQEDGAWSFEQELLTQID